MNVFVFAIDGASPDLVNRWISQGYLSHIAKVKGKGLSGRLESTFPPLTGPAWSSFQTGVNPGKHRVYNWLDLSGSYEGRVVNRSSIKVKTAWNALSVNGCKVGLLSLPMTYPPEKVNGFIVPGFLTPEKAPDRSYPARFSEELTKAQPEFQYGVNQYLGGSRRSWVQDIKEAVSARGKAARFLIKQELSESLSNDNEDALFLVHFLSSDLVQHYLWDCVTEDWDPRFDVFNSIDEQIGAIMELAPSDSVFLIVSDHGFGPIERIFNVNNWLRKEGYLRLKGRVGTSVKRGLSRIGFNQHKLAPMGEKVYTLARQLGFLSGNLMNDTNHPLLKKSFLSSNDVDWENTIAYSRCDIGHVRLNLVGREQKGILDLHSSSDIRDEIIRKLEQVKLPGSDVVRMADWVKPKESIYEGPYLQHAPDILFNPLNQKTLGFGGVMFVSNKQFASPFRPGNHRRDGLLMACGPAIKQGTVNASILDIAPTLLNLFSTPVPVQMDGKVIGEIAPEQPSYTKPNDFYIHHQETKEGAGSREKLEGLGYL